MSRSLMWGSGWALLIAYCHLCLSLAIRHPAHVPAQPPPPCCFRRRCPGHVNVKRRQAEAGVKLVRSQPGGDSDAWPGFRQIVRRVGCASAQGDMVGEEHSQEVECSDARTRMAVRMQDRYGDTAAGGGWSAKGRGYARPERLMDWHERELRSAEGEWWNRRLAEDNASR